MKDADCIEALKDMAKVMALDPAPNYDVAIDDIKIQMINLIPQVMRQDPFRESTWKILIAIGYTDKQSANPTHRSKRKKKWK